ncbi:unnamed protein product [Arabidopsis halleri]
MSSRIVVFTLLILHFFQCCSGSGLTNSGDTTLLLKVKKKFTRSPKSWKGSDPCRTWVGITCNNSRVVEISLVNLNVQGTLSASISFLSELEILDLTANPKLTGRLPPNIGELKKLTILNLMGCDFSGQIPESIGDLEQLTRLTLNLNKFRGTIPASIGRLSKLDWLDIADNQIEGEIPVSSGTSSYGLDMLLQAQHFHFGNNKLSGEIPEKLFSSKMTLIHVLFDGNKFTGKIPKSLSDVITLEVLDVSNNSLKASVVPSWISSLPSLSTLRMEGINLEGPIPVSFFTPPLLETVNLKGNLIDATLDFGTDYSNQLELVDLQYNDITDYKPPTHKRIQVILADNPVCLEEEGNKLSDYCKVIKHNASLPVTKTCPRCGEDKEPIRTSCLCVYPITGVLTFRSPSFSGYFNNTNFNMLQQRLEEFFKNPNYPVDSVAIKNITESIVDHHLLIYLLLSPLDKESFNQTEMNSVISGFSKQMFVPPERYGPYFFKADQYILFSGIMKTCHTIKSNLCIIIRAVLGAVIFLLLLTIVGIYALRLIKRASDQNNPFAKLDTSQSSIDVPQLMGAKAFTFEVLRKCADNFSETNDIGEGGYGQVYRGMLPSGQLIAIKRAKRGSLQGGLEFKTEIELLSRVHHKNVVRLLGFCFDRGEQMIVYEYIQNGCLRDSLSGKNGIRLDWTRRLKIALGSGKGLAYLHEHADPPIIHRDIKSNNILLDENLTAKVADFGLSKLVGDPGKTHVTTQVKGTLGYLDPEYYMTNQLTEKSDVYGFGVVMLELLTGKIPIGKGKHVVKEMKMKMDKSRNLYDLQEFLDTKIITNSENLKGFENYVDLALRCVEVEGVNRPSMGEVVKEIENIMQIAGINPNVDSIASSRMYEE